MNPNGEIGIVRSPGRIQALEDRLEETPLRGQIGIGHTRWATHGPPTEENAHPHLGGDGEVAVAHNGVIENYAGLKERLQSQGYLFRSATDTEVIAHLIAYHLRMIQSDGTHFGDLPDEPYQKQLTAVQRAIAELRGTYGLAVLFRDHPDVIIVARLGSPLVIGVAEHEHYVASDATPLAGYTDQIVYLADHQVAVVTAESLRVTHRERGQVQHDVRVLDIEATSVTLDRRLSALHAQGNLRAASDASRQHARTFV